MNDSIEWRLNSPADNENGNLLISRGLDRREVKIDEVDIMLEENVLYFARCGGLNREISKCLVYLEYLLIKKLDFGS